MADMFDAREVRPPPLLASRSPNIELAYILDVFSAKRRTKLEPERCSWCRRCWCGEACLWLLQKDTGAIVMLDKEERVLQDSRYPRGRVTNDC